jgi:hypothetical protein
MRKFNCEVYGPKGSFGCVTISGIEASSPAIAKMKAIPQARVLWLDIPAKPKVIVKEIK